MTRSAFIRSTFLFIGCAGVFAQNAPTPGRRVWTLPDYTDLRGSVSRDGRYLPYIIWDDGDLFVHDFTTGSDRRITNNGNERVLGVVHEYVVHASVSRDSRRVAYAWSAHSGRVQVRVADVTPSDIPTSRVLFDRADVLSSLPCDWSPDGNWLAVQIHKRTENQIGVLSTRTGALRVLQSIGSSESTELMFSPDGRYLAFDLPAGGPGDRRDVFVASVQGTAGVPAVVTPSDETVLGWSSDGTRLLFIRHQSGSAEVWSVVCTDGKTVGAPSMVMTLPGTLADASLTASGAVYHSPPIGGTLGDLVHTAFDFATNTWTSAPTPDRRVGTAENRQHPDWSSDGRFLAYGSSPITASRAPFVIKVRDVATGDTRTVTPVPSFLLFNSLKWAPDGMSFLVRGGEPSSRIGIFRVSASSGEASMEVPLVPREGLLWNTALSPDMRTLYYGTEQSLVARQLPSANERQLIRAFVSEMSLSGDGRYVATVVTDPKSGVKTTLAIPVSGGRPRELMRVGLGSRSAGSTNARRVERLRVLMWAPDSRSVFLRQGFADGAVDDEVWRVGLEGAVPRNKMVWTLDRRASEFRVHPDGRQVVFQRTVPGAPREILVIEGVSAPAK